MKDAQPGGGVLLVIGHAATDRPSSSAAYVRSVLAQLGLREWSPARYGQPDLIVICGFQSADELLSSVRAARSSHRASVILALSPGDDSVSRASALDAGASSCINESSTEAEILAHVAALRRRWMLG